MATCAIGAGNFQKLKVRILLTEGVKAFAIPYHSSKMQVAVVMKLLH